MQTPSEPPVMSKEQARKTLVNWLRALIFLIVIAIPAYFVVQAGRKIDLNRSLFEAIGRNDAPTVGFLLSVGADANAHNPQEDKRSLVQKIYENLRGIPDPPGLSPLQVYLSPVRAGKDPLHPESRRPENLPMLTALLDHHADPNVHMDYNGYTPLQTGMIEWQDDTVQALLKHGAKISGTDLMGEDALSAAVLCGAIHNDPKRIRILLNAGADINSRDLDKRTPLMHAAAMKDAVAVKALIASGADIHAKDSAGNSALTLARQKQASPVLDLLVAAGAK